MAGAALTAVCPQPIECIDQRGRVGDVLPALAALACDLSLAVTTDQAALDEPHQRQRPQTFALFALDHLVVAADRRLSKGVEVRRAMTKPSDPYSAETQMNSKWRLSMAR